MLKTEIVSKINRRESHKIKEKIKNIKIAVEEDARQE